MYLVLIVLILIASLLMIGIVMIQNSKGGGLASAFASSNQIMGVRKTTDFLEKFTWGCAVAMVVLSVAASYCLPHATTAAHSVFKEEAQQENVVNPISLPGFDASQEPSDAE